MATQPARVAGDNAPSQRLQEEVDREWQTADAWVRWAASM